MDPDKPSSSLLSQEETARPFAQAGARPDPAFQFEPFPGNPGIGTVVEALLKKPGSLLHELSGPRRNGILLRLLVITTFCALIYGLVVGSLSGGTQLWAAPVKITLGLFFSVLICLPSLYIFLCLSGADLRFGQVCGTLLGLVSLMALLLIGFAPVAWIFSQSTHSVVLMGALHLIFWIIALWFGARLLWGLLAYCKSPDSGQVKVWVILFVLVSLQMTTVLRPLVGTADTLLPTEKKFFLAHWISVMEQSGR